MIICTTQDQLLLDELKCSCIIEYGDGDDFEKFWKREWDVDIEFTDHGETTILTDKSRNLVTTGDSLDECFKKWRDAKQHLLVGVEKE